MNQSTEALCQTLGYHFKDMTLLAQALSHRSVGSKNNERLEFLGDSILSFIISNSLYHRHLKAKEGELTRLRASLVKGDTLAEIARGFKLGEYLHLGVGEMKSGGHRRRTILADALEAIIAAIYHDSDIDTTQQVVLGWYQSRLDKLTKDTMPKDPKTCLQEYLQAQQRPLPEYTVVKTEGEQHNQTFTIECRIVGVEGVTTGVADSRRRAEQQAAQTFLQRLLHDE